MRDSRPPTDLRHVERMRLFVEDGRLARCP